MRFRSVFAVTNVLTSKSCKICSFPEKLINSAFFLESSKFSRNTNLATRSLLWTFWKQKRMFFLMRRWFHRNWNLVVFAYVRTYVYTSTDYNKSAFCTFTKHQIFLITTWFHLKSSTPKKVFKKCRKISKNQHIFENIEKSLKIEDGKSIFLPSKIGKSIWVLYLVCYGIFDKFRKLFLLRFQWSVVKSAHPFANDCNETAYCRLLRTHCQLTAPVRHDLPALRSVNLH